MCTTGSVNASLSGIHPLGITSGFLGMFIQSIPGGKGVGMMYMVMFVLITVFVVGLMSGRTPEYLSVKITGHDVLLVMVAFLLHPISILIPTVTAYASGAAAAIGVNGSSIGFTQILWEFTSASANNGSDFLGAQGNTPFFNIATAISHFNRTLWSNSNLACTVRLHDRAKTNWHHHRAQNRHITIYYSSSCQHHHTCSVIVLPVLGDWTNLIILRRVKEWLLMKRKL